MAEVGGAPGASQATGEVVAQARSRAPPGGDVVSLLEAGFQASMAGLAIVSGPELRYELVNESYRSFCPDPTGPAPGRRLEDAGPLTAQPLAAQARAILAEGGAVRGEAETIDGSGRQRWLEYQLRRVSSVGGAGVLVELHDRTALVQAHLAIEASAAAASRQAARLEDVMGTIPHGVMVFDADGRIIRMNPAAVETWRAAGIEFRAPGAVLSELELRGEDGRPVPASEWPVGRALAGERVLGAHLRVTPEGARPIWMLASAAPIVGALGKVIGAVLSFSDETAAHELAEARDDLVRMVSHDLRTPLSSIYAQAHLIRRAAEPGSQLAERATAIERSCGRMSGMIQDLVEVTLLEAGQLPVTVTTVDVGALAPDIVEGLRGALPVDRVRLRIGPGCRARLDPARLERIVVNLVSNALKYSSREVDVCFEHRGEVVVLSVADTGVGISAEDQVRVFERYYRARGDRRPEGLGLGLYITRLLVEGMGGRIEVESRLGGGSTFRVLLPAAAPEPRENPGIHADRAD